jgi:hypothetical protein
MTYKSTPKKILWQQKRKQLKKQQKRQLEKLLKSQQRERAQRDNSLLLEKMTSPIGVIFFVILC